MCSLGSWRVRLGLWPRMAMAISVGFISLFAALAFLAERALEDSADRILEERRVIAQMAASQIDALLQEAVAELERDLVLAKNLPDFLTPGADISQIPVNDQTHENRSFTISEPYYDATIQRGMVAIALPMLGDQEITSPRVGLIDLENPAILATLQQAASLGLTGHASLVNRQGQTLASTYGLPFLAPGEHASFYRRAMMAGAPTVETVAFEIEWEGETIGEMHVMAFAPLKNAPWGVAVGGDELETFAGVARLRFGLVVLGTSTLAIVLAATLIGARKLLKPVRDMTKAAQHIASGSLYTPLQISHGGEMGALAHALEQMRLQMLTNILELEEWNGVLEIRVKEKTAHLRQQQALTRQLLRQVITAQEEERARISRDLHDEIGQTLTALELSIDRMEKITFPEGTDANRLLEQMRKLTQQALVDLRLIIAAMRPGVLDELGLVPALGWVSDHTLRPLGIDVSIDVDGSQARLPSEIETVLFRIAQEAMNNTARYSQAREFRVTLSIEQVGITMTMADDGHGFDPENVQLDPDRARGLGLVGMKERASLVGGHVDIESEPSQGTVIRVRIPLDSVPDPEIIIGARYVAVDTPARR